MVSVGLITSYSALSQSDDPNIIVIQTSASFSDKPIKNRHRESGKWNIAFVQSGNYVKYDESLYGILIGLRELNFIKLADIPDKLSGKMLWEYIVKNVKSDYIHFLPDGFYNIDWVPENAAKMEAELYPRKDVDLIIGAGTVAGEHLYKKENTIPTFIVSASNAVRSGFSLSREDSGKDNFNTHIDPNNYPRQLRIFYMAVKFGKLGIPYEDTENGRVYAGYDDVITASKQMGFTPVFCKTTNDDPDEMKVFKSLKKCFTEFSEGDNKVDAVYFTEHGVSPDHLKELASYLNVHKIPSFSQSGEHEVVFGFMMSLSHSGIRNVGKYTATKIAKFFNGANPRWLTQYYEDLPRLSVNSKAIDEVGIKLPEYIKQSIDETYRDY